jgi:peptidoglycan/LPS O-acetylase OafA/YrhL
MMSLERLGNVHVIPRFYIRRLFRIYPLAIVIVLIALVLEIPPHFEAVYERPSNVVVWQNLFLVQNLFGSPEIVGPMWSLPLEVQMYLVLPFIYFAAKKIRSYLGVTALILSGFVVWYIDSHIARAWHYPSLFPYAPWFFMGIAAYAGCKIAKPVVGARYFGLSILLLILVPSLAQRYIGDYRTGWASWGSGVLFVLALPFFQQIKSEALARHSHTIATYSYSIYLSHVPIMWLAFQQLSSHPLWLQTSVFVILMITVPCFLYYVVEAPFIRFGSRVAERLLLQEHSRTAVSLQRDLAR